MQLTSQSLLSGTGFRAVAIGLVALLGLTACGGSDSSSSDYSYAYIQFYNASPNGANVEMREVDGDSFGSARVGSAEFGSARPSLVIQRLCFQWMMVS